MLSPSKLLIRHAGFSLTEFLLVLSALVILFSLLLPTFKKAMEHARSIRCENHLRQLGTVYHFYGEDNAGEIPNRPGYPYFRTNFYSTGYLSDYISVYHESTNSPHDNDILGCPSEEDQTQVDSLNGSKYRGSHYGRESRVRHMSRPHFWDKSKPNKGLCHPYKAAVVGDATASPGPHGLRLNYEHWKNTLAGAYTIGVPDISRHSDFKINIWFIDGHVERVGDWISGSMPP